MSDKLDSILHRLKSTSGTPELKDAESFAQKILELTQEDSAHQTIRPGSRIRFRMVSILKASTYAAAILLVALFIRLRTDTSCIKAADTDNPRRTIIVSEKRTDITVNERMKKISTALHIAKLQNKEIL